MGNDATVHLKGDSKQLNSELKKGGQSVMKFGKAIKAAAVVAIAAFAVKKLVQFGGAALAAFEKQEAAERKMAAVIKATGGAAGWSADQMAQYAGELQKTTKFADEVTLDAMAIIATFKEIKGEAFARTTRAAQDMATVLGQDLKGASMQLAKALNDPAKGMTMLTKSGVSFTDAQKEMVAEMMKVGDIAGAQNVILGEMEGQFGGAAAEAAKTFGGVMTQLYNRIGDLWEVMGSLLAPILGLLVPLFDGLVTAAEKYLPIGKQITDSIVKMAGAVWEWMQPAIEWINETFTQGWVLLSMVVESTVKFVEEQMAYFGNMMKGSVGGTFSWLGGIIEWFQDLWVNVWVGAMVVIENFGTAVNLATNLAVLGLMQAWGEIEHYFTSTLPAILGWLADNWANILMDMANIQAAILMNMWKNFVNFTGNIIALISGQKTDWKWTGLTEGFKSSMSELPEIAGRVKSEAEKKLEGEIQADAKILVKAFTEKKSDFEARVAKELAGGEAFVIPTDEPGRGGGDDEESKEDDDKGFNASIEGLTALNKRITSAAADSPEKKIEDEVKKQGEAQVKATEKVADEAKKTNDKQDAQIAELIGMREDLKDVGGLA